MWIESFQGWNNLTPSMVLEYLQKKPKYLSMWKQLVPNVFDEKTFCNYFNNFKEQLYKNKENGEYRWLDTKIKRLQEKSNMSNEDVLMLNSYKKEKNTIYYNILNESFNLSAQSSIKIKDIFYPLIWSLLNIFKYREKKEKIKENTKNQIKINNDKDVSEIKYIWFLLKSYIGKENYKEFASVFFKEIKKYEEESLQNIIDVIEKLMKKYNIENNETNLSSLIDILQRLRKTQKSKSKTDK